jgi:hypothetical protein
MSGPAAIALLLALGAAPAHAQQATAELIATMTGGAWEISNAERDKSCTALFRADASAGGHKVEFDRACANVFPMTRDVVAWGRAPNDGVTLLGRGGAILLEFTEVEAGLFEGERPGEGLYFMQNVAAGPAWRTAEQMTGDWVLMRGPGRPVCALTLSNTAAAQNGFAVRVKPGCDQAITRFAPATWRMDRGELVLAGRGAAWRFEESDPVTWRRVPATADGLSLVRQ